MSDAMNLVLFPSQSPNKICIVQFVNEKEDKSWLHPWIPCCVVVPMWNEGSWVCPECDKKLDPQPDDDFDLTNQVWITQHGIRTTSAGEIKRWVSRWTGLQFDDFELGIK